MAITRNACNSLLGVPTHQDFAHMSYFFTKVSKVLIDGIARNHVDCCCLFFVGIVHLLTCNFISTLTARWNMDDDIPVASHTRVPACSAKL